MEENTSSKLTVEQLQSGEMPSIFSLLDISVFDIVINLVLFISLIILFLALLRIYKSKNISALKYLVITFGIFIASIVIPLVLLFFTLLVPEIFDAYEGELETLFMYIEYIFTFFAAVFLFIGALKLRKYANAL